MSKAYEPYEKTALCELYEIIKLLKSGKLFTFQILPKGLKIYSSKRKHSIFLILLL